MVDWGLGDASRPRHFCRECERVEYCPHPGRARNPPEVSKRRLRRGCPRREPGKRWSAELGCSIQYMAGVAPSLRGLMDRREET